MEMGRDMKKKEKTRERDNQGRKRKRKSTAILTKQTPGLGWTPEEMHVHLAAVRKSLMDSSVHSYVFFYSVWGQKPV